MTVTIGRGKSLSIEDVAAVALRGAKVRLAPGVSNVLLRNRKFLERKIAQGDVIYGVNTGFGQLANVRVSARELGELQVNLLRSHAVGTGAMLPDSAVKAMLLLRAHALAQGVSGIRPVVVETLVKVLNAGICPCVPEQGSVGASGDLAPLAHLALVLIGEGRARVRGKMVSGRQALHMARVKPLVLQAKEGLALINGTQFMTALGALAQFEAEALVKIADGAGAMSLEAFRGTASPFDPHIQYVRPHPGQVETARRLRAFLRPGGRASAIAKSHADCSRVQDPYSFRCMPQVHGAARDVLDFTRTVLEREINSVTDNPLVFEISKLVLSGGNFHGEVVAMALDALAIAVAEVASISEERLAKLVNPSLSELPAFLTRHSGLNSGFMMVQVAAASLVSENKTLCHPASVDSIPTSADKEDHVSMGAWGSRKATAVVQNTRRVLAMEYLAAAQGLDLLRPLRSSVPLEKIHRVIRSHIKRMDRDREFHPDLKEMECLILDPKFQELHA